MPRNRETALVEKPDRDLLEHIQRLGIESVDAYREWCGSNGFSRKLAKSWNQRCRERSHLDQEIARERLRRKKRETRSSSRILIDICEGRLGEEDVTQPYLVRLCQALKPVAEHSREPEVDRSVLAELLCRLHYCHAKVFDGTPVVAAYSGRAGNTCVEALTLVAAHYRSWLRPIDGWKPRTHNARRQFGSLLRHLFARFDDVPRFFDAAWFAGRSDEATEHREWFLHVGQGRNIRHCRLPIAFTKAMARHFMQAPDDFGIAQAFRWGQVHGLGGDEPLARAIIGTRLGDGFEHDEFWRTAIAWFIEHPMLDRSRVGPIVDYLHHQRFVPEPAPGDDGERRPAQPNLTMKGRTPESLLRQVESWHRRLGRDNTHQIREWCPSGIDGFESVEGSQSGGNLKCWTIRELLSGAALVAEGRKMKHCVASYVESCARRICSIWTLEVESFDGRSKVLTVEVRHDSRSIVQARGKTNRLPTEKERGILRRWAVSAGLTVAGHV